MPTKYKDMTQEEFDSIPELPDSDQRVLWHEENDPLEWTDTKLHTWDIGYIHGVRYRRRIY